MEKQKMFQTTNQSMETSTNQLSTNRSFMENQSVRLTTSTNHLSMKKPKIAAFKNIMGHQWIWVQLMSVLVTAWPRLKLEKPQK
jgi:hypothetical protein